MKNEIIENIIKWNPVDEDSFLRERDNIIKLSDVIAERIENDRRIIFVSIGLISDIVKGLAHDIDYHFSYNQENIISLNSGLSQRPLDSDWKKLGDIGQASIFDLMDINLSEDDVVIGLSSSGHTSYVTSAMNYASSITKHTYLITNSENPSVEIENVVTISINDDPIDIGSFTGITVTKLLIDKLFFIAMMKAGRVYKNKSLFKKWNYENKIDKIIENLSLVSGKTIEDSLEYFEKADKVMQVAACMMLLELSKSEAIDILKRNRNNFNKILKL